MSKEIKNTITDTDYKVFEYITDDPVGWTFGAIDNRLQVAKKIILQLIQQHCNENEIALAVGEEAQILQAFELDVVKTAAEHNASLQSE
tara:strand:+ start:1862 stop:2128 length:267 start_codon:yes stop_codon:yes gene_type:complete